MSSSSSRSEPGAPAVVLLAGREATLRDAARGELRARVLGGGSRDFNEDRFDFAAAGTEAALVIASARTLPMLASGRLVCVRGLEDRRARGFLERDLVEYLDAPVASTCLLLEAERVDRRQRWVKLVAKHGEVRDCSAPTRPAQVRDWITERLRAQGKRAGPGVASALFDAVGADLDRLASEIDKLVVYAGDSARVTAEQVADLTGQTRALAIYELSDAVGSRSRAEALRVVGRLLDQGEAPLAILGALAQHLRRMLRALECQPLSPQVVQKQLGMHPFAAEKLVSQLRRFDRARVLAALAGVRATDAVLKGAAPISPRHGLEQLLLRICG